MTFLLESYLEMKLESWLSKVESIVCDRVTEHWNQLPINVLEFSSLEIFKMSMDAFCATYCREPALADGWTQ